jgi:hypothetical protein
VEPDREQILKADTAGAEPLYFPAGQTKHDVALVPETDPVAQGAQLLALAVDE